MNKRININKRGLRSDFSWLPVLESIIIRQFKFVGTISIALVDKTEIRRLNKVYRKKDKITDVLSFNIDSREILGEIVICLDRAREQAKAKQRTLKSELQLLTVHGILHLLGYDHEKSAQEAERQELVEGKILSILNK